MQATTPPRASKFLIATLLALAPAGAAFAAQDCSGDAFAAYNMTLGGQGSSYKCVQATWQPAAQGPSGPVIAAADMACGRDPFDGYRRGFNTGGPAQLCGLSQSGPAAGARGPAGPTMSDQRSDPFYRYAHTFPAD